MAVATYALVSLPIGVASDVAHKIHINCSQSSSAGVEAGPEAFQYRHIGAEAVEHVGRREPAETGADYCNVERLCNAGHVASAVFGT